MAILGRAFLLRRELKRSERLIARAWFDAVDNVRATVTWTRIAQELESGAAEEVAQLLLTRAVMTGVLEEMRATYSAGAQTVVDGVPRNVRDPRGGRLLFRFDIGDPRAEQWLAKQSAEFVTGRVQAQQRDAIRAAVSRGTRLGQNPRRTALDIVGRIDRTTGRRTGGVVGLSGPQGRAVTRARTELATGQYSAYKRRTRRDRRLDHMVNRAAKSGVPLKQAQIDRIVGSYSDRLLMLRGETIAQTEALQAFNEGRREAFRQLYEQTNLQEQDVIRKWDATMDRYTRKDHRAMDGQERGPEEPFEAPDRSLLMHPGDTSKNADASQIVNCRCLEVIEADFIAAEARRSNAA